MTTKEEVFESCIINGNILKLPDTQLDRELYLEVKKSLELIGGKWKGGKVSGFVFQQNPTDYFEKIKNGETANLKKEYQFFATPEKLADHMVELANLNSMMKVLEPSAGQGALIKAIKKVEPLIRVDCYELMDLNYMMLLDIPGVTLCGNDFLECDKTDKYDLVIANPPFTKNQDIDHIYKMYEVTKPGGRIVTLSSKHWQISNNKKETEFKNWLEDKEDYYIEEIERGTFKESGTNIETLLILIDKDKDIASKSGDEPMK